MIDSPDILYSIALAGHCFCPRFCCGTREGVILLSGWQPHSTEREGLALSWGSRQGITQIIGGFCTTLSDWLPVLLTPHTVCLCGDGRKFSSDAPWDLGSPTPTFWSLQSLLAPLSCSPTLGGICCDCWLCPSFRHPELRQLGTAWL